MSELHEKNETFEAVKKKVLELKNDIYENAPGHNKDDFAWFSRMDDRIQQILDKDRSCADAYYLKSYLRVCLRRDYDALSVLKQVFFEEVMPLTYYTMGKKEIKEGVYRQMARAALTNFYKESEDSLYNAYRDNSYEKTSTAFRNYTQGVLKQITQDTLIWDYLNKRGETSERLTNFDVYFFWNTVLDEVLRFYDTYEFTEEYYKWSDLTVKSYQEFINACIANMMYRLTVMDDYTLDNFNVPYIKIHFQKQTSWLEHHFKKILFYLDDGFFLDTSNDVWDCYKDIRKKINYCNMGVRNMNRVMSSSSLSVQPNELMNKAMIRLRDEGEYGLSEKLAGIKDKQVKLSKVFNGNEGAFNLFLETRCNMYLEPYLKFIIRKEGEIDEENKTRFQKVFGDIEQILENRIQSEKGEKDEMSDVEFSVVENEIKEYLKGDANLK